MMEKSKRDRWLNLPNQRAWKRELQKLLCGSDLAVESALVRIYDLQTPLEKATDMAVQANGFGFDRVDAQHLSKYANMVKMGHHLTKTEICIVRSRILKYWKQLMVLSKQKLKAEEEEERRQHEALQVLPGSEDITVNSINVATDDVPVDAHAGMLTE